MQAAVIAVVSSGPMMECHRLPWSSSQDMLLKKLWTTARVPDIALKLGRTVGAVYEHAAAMDYPSRKLLRDTLTVELLRPKKRLRRKVHIQPKFKKARRRCLGCGEYFRSVWCGNLLCRRCGD